MRRASTLPNQNFFSKTLEGTQPHLHTFTSGYLSTFNFLDTKNTIEQNYALLLDKHKDPFKTIAKTTTDVSLLTISASIKDFQDVIKALLQTNEISSPGRPK
jgi:hypothetical protein